MEEQGKFTAKRSCIDQLFALRQTFAAIFDLEKAYDRVNR